MAFDPQSAWVTVVQVGAAALSPVIAVVGGWIAWQQVRINRNKLKLDRFDKRFEIYEAAMAFVAHMVTNGAVHDESERDFQLKTRGARFLVSKEIDDYLSEIMKMAGQLRMVKIQMEMPLLSEAKREEVGNKWIEIQTWFQAQFDVLPEKFGPFLSVDDI
ncbi:hypothetical protein ACEPUD_06360 [Burkholderia ubonensis]|uniref:hypothetical protein n=1 Tax=Burkholderia ubonensis TaxID=101571 RepID=UPI00358E7AAE